jgi:hypothetical protein
LHAYLRITLENLAAADTLHFRRGS